MVTQSEILTQDGWHKTRQQRHESSANPLMDVDEIDEASSAAGRVSPEKGTLMTTIKNAPNVAVRIGQEKYQKKEIWHQKGKKWFLCLRPLAIYSQ